MKHSMNWGVALLGAWVLTAPAGCGSRVSLGDDGLQSERMDGSAGTTQQGSSINQAGTATDDQPTASAGGSGIAQAGTTSGGQGGSFGAPLSCPATCADDAGPERSIATIEELHVSITGRWLICPGKSSSIPVTTIPGFPGGLPDVVGVEFEPPEPEVSVDGLSTRLIGRMYYLVEGRTGLERKADVNYEGLYWASPQDGSEGPPQTLHLQHPASRFDASFVYAPCPRKWAISGPTGHADEGATLVPLE